MVCGKVQFVVFLFNLDQFDYRKYLVVWDIYYQVFVDINWVWLEYQFGLMSVVGYLCIKAFEILK